MLRSGIDTSQLANVAGSIQDMMFPGSKKSAPKQAPASKDSVPQQTPTPTIDCNWPDIFHSHECM